MGPTNMALVLLYEADQRLRQARERLDAATKNVRVQERRVHDLEERLRLAQQKMKENQAQAAGMELDVKSRDARIERLRTQQQNAKNNREYQAFLVEINTEKVDRNKVEEQAIRALEQVERGHGEIGEVQGLLEAERGKLSTMKAEIGQTVATLQAEIDAIVPERQKAAEAVPGQAREAFERLASRYDGEAMSPISKPDRRREEYMCTACNMDLVTDVYNRLHSRDELVYCPSCRRILYIPENLTPENAVHRPKESRPRQKRVPRGKGIAAAVGRQTSAVDVMRSIMPEPEQAPAEAEPSQTVTSSEPSETPESSGPAQQEDEALRAAEQNAVPAAEVVSAPPDERAEVQAEEGDGGQTQQAPGGTEQP